MHKLGLKLWSTNLSYIKEIQRLYAFGVFDYIELFSVPETYETISTWKSLKVPYVIHGPHYTKGLNFADKNCFEKNLQLVAQAQKFADELGAEIIIFHPGVSGDIDQTIFQLNKINDPRIVIENKPYFGIVDNIICNGSSPAEIEKILKQTNVGFCLDFAHAVFAANALKIDKIKFIEQFMQLEPKMFHVTDGQWDGVFDEHPNLGQGNFEFDKLKKFFSPNSMITIETKHNYLDSLRDFEEDVRFLKKTCLIY
jgi:endonuclease IV